MKTFFLIYDDLELLKRAVYSYFGDIPRMVGEKYTKLKTCSTML